MMKQNQLPLRNLLKNSLFKLGIVCLWSCMVIHQSYAQHIEIIKFKNLQQLVFNQSDTSYVVNFMSSWCKPCIKELPEFIKLANDTHNKKIKVLFVSLDIKKNMDETIKPIATKFKINFIYLLDESNPNTWIDKLDKNWSGEIPSTFIIKKGKIRNKNIGGISYQQLIKILK